MRANRMRKWLAKGPPSSLISNGRREQSDLEILKGSFKSTWPLTMGTVRAKRYIRSICLKPEPNSPDVEKTPPGGDLPSLVWRPHGFEARSGGETSAIRRGQVR